MGRLSGSCTQFISLGRVKNMRTTNAKINLQAHLLTGAGSAGRLVYRCNSSKRKTRENVESALSVAGEQVTKDMEMCFSQPSMPWLDKQMNMNLTEVHRGKCQVLHLERNNPSAGCETNSWKAAFQERTSRSWWAPS